MNAKRYLMAALAVFVFFVVFDFVWHGVLLADIYNETQALWRPEAEWQALYPWTLLLTLAFAALIAFLFTRNYERKGMGEGLRFGLYIGLLIGLMHAGAYFYMPIPFALAGLWFVGGVLWGLGAGVILAALYRA